MKVTVILPTYGRPENLKRAIESVINQTFDDWELIIVDDNNPDTEGRYLTEQLIGTVNDTRIRYIKHERNLNGAQARNTAIQYSQGEYISFLDDDDEYLPDRLKKCVDVLDCDMSYGGVYTGCYFEKDNKIYRKKRKCKTGNFLVETLSTTFESHSGSNLFIRSNIVKELGGFDVTFTRHQDYEFLVRFFVNNNIRGISEYLLIKHENGQNLPNLQKMERIKEHYLKKYEMIISEQTTKDQKQIYYSHYIYLAMLGLETGDIEFCKNYVEKAKSYKMIDLKNLARLGLLYLKQQQETTKRD